MYPQTVGGSIFDILSYGHVDRLDTFDATIGYVYSTARGRTTIGLCLCLCYATTKTRRGGTGHKNTHNTLTQITQTGRKNIASFGTLVSDN